MLRSVDDWDGGHFAFGASVAAHPAPGGGISAGAIAIDHGPNGPSATIPDAHFLFTAQFARAGADLVLHGEDAKTLIVHDYFATDARARLLSPEGAALSGDVVAALAGPLVPGQYAQGAAATAPAGVQTVGRVAQASADATIVRNGVAIAAHAGDAIHKGDVLQTVSGELGVTFNDGSTLNLTANSRLVVNEFVYSPNNANNSQLLNLVQGSLTFISGEVAHTGTMNIGTPVATMGIRGTVGGVTTANDGTVHFYVSQSATGAVILDSRGTIIANVVQDGPMIVVRPVGPLQVVADEVQKSPAQLAIELQALQHIVSIQSVGQQILQQFFQQDPNNSPNPQSTGTPHTQFQIDLHTNPSPESGGNNIQIPNSGTITITPAPLPPLPDAPPQQYLPPVVIQVPIPQNLTPINFGPLQQTVGAGGGLEFSTARANAISVFDADSAILKVTLTASHGVVTLAGIAGLTFTNGDGASDATMTFSGTQAAINAALDGLKFTPSNGYTGVASVQIVTSDGIANPVTEVIGITVNSAAPVLDYFNLTVAQGGTVVLSPSDFHITDPDSSSFFFSVTNVTGGEFEVFNGTNWVSAPTGGFSAADIAAGHVRFVHDGGEAAPTFTVWASDNTDASAAINPTVNFTNINDAPVINGGNSLNLYVPENTTAVTTVQATDVDGPSVTYTIIHGNGSPDASKFTIDTATGELSFISGRDYEHPTDANHNGIYTVQVSASDGSLSDIQTLYVHVTDVNEAPTITSNGGHSTASVYVAEDHRSVTTVHASDPDFGDQVRYSIVGGEDSPDAALFTINQHTGALSFIASPNYEQPADANQNNIYTVQVRASDGSVSDVQTISVHVTNVNEAPVIAGPSTLNVNVAENIRTVTTVQATDPDAGSHVTYSVVGGFNSPDAAKFTIDPQTGALSFISAPDYENPTDSNHNNIYTVQVRASDGSLSDIQTISVHVTNVDEAPVVSTVFSENFDQETLVGNGRNYTGLENWIVSSGSVDLAGRSGALSAQDYYPGHGLYLDLAGSTGQVGTLTSKTVFAAGTYVLEFDLAGPHRNSAGTSTAHGVNDSVTVSFGSFTEVFALTTAEVLHVTRTVTLDSDAHIVVQDMGLSGNGNIGAIFFGGTATSIDAVQATTYVESDNSVAINPELALSDVDSANLTSATITLTNHQTGDLLSVTGGLPNGISASSYDANTGVLVLTGLASVAAYEAALHEVGFSSNSASAVDRVISVVVNDGAANSNALNSIVHVTGINAPPTVDLDSTLPGTGYVASVAPDDTAVAVFGDHLSFNAGTAGMIESATANLHGTTAYVDYNNMRFYVDVSALEGAQFANGEGTFGDLTWHVAGGATFTLVVSGAASAAEYEQLFDAVRFTTHSLDHSDYSVDVTISGETLDSNVATAVIHIDTAPPGELLANGSFEDAYVNYSESYALNRWTVGGDTSDNTAVVDSGEGALVHGGLYDASLGGVQSDVTLSQNISTAADMHYTLSFWLANDTAAGEGSQNDFGVTWNGAALMPSIENADQSDYTHYVFDVTGAADQSTLEFAALNTDGHWHLDDVSVRAGAPNDQQEIASGTVSYAGGAGPHSAEATADGLPYLGNFTIGGLTEPADSSPESVGSVAWHFALSNGELDSLSPHSITTQSYDVTVGDNQSDTIASLKASVSIGGPDGDTFIFNADQHLGADTIVNFNTATDHVELDYYFDNAGELSAAIGTTGADSTHGSAIIDLGTTTASGQHDTVTIANVTQDYLQQHLELIHLVNNMA